MKGLFFAAVLLVAACGPKYVTKTDYYPPSSAAGLACVSNCQNLKINCEQNCQNDRKFCQDQAWSDAQLTLPTALEIYAVELEHFDRQTAIYNRSIKVYNKLKTGLLKDKSKQEAWCRKNKLSHCERADDIDDMLEDLRQEYYSGGPLSSKPGKPEKPTLRSEANMLIAQRCNQPCTCENQFKLCYRQCGGHIETRKVCVSNCKNEK